jgi:hypothetical protein
MRERTYKTVFGLTAALSLVMAGLFITALVTNASPDALLPIGAQTVAVLLLSVMAYRAVKRGTWGGNLIWIVMGLAWLSAFWLWQRAL